MLCGGIIGRDSQRLAQNRLAVSVSVKTAIEVGEVHIGLDGPQPEPHRRTILGFCFGAVSAPREERTECDARLWPIGIEVLHIHMFLRCALGGLTVVGR